MPGGARRLRPRSFPQIADLKRNESDTQPDDPGGGTEAENQRGVCQFTHVVDGGRTTHGCKLMDDATAQKIVDFMLNPENDGIKADDFALAKAINEAPTTIDRGRINPELLWDVIEAADYIELSGQKRAAFDGVMRAMQIDMASAGIRSILAAVFEGTPSAAKLVEFQTVPTTLGEKILDGRRDIDHGDIKLARRYLIRKDLEAQGVDSVVALKIGDEVINNRIEVKDAAAEAAKLAADAVEAVNG